MRMEVIENGRSVPKDQHKAVLVASTERFHARNLHRISRAQSVRRSHYAALAHERESVVRAIMAVEHRLVEAMWVLSRLPEKDSARGFSNRHGIDYPMEKDDKWGSAVANGGWLDTPPKPAAPSAQSIDAMYDPLAWLSWLGRIDGKLVAAAAASRRGQMKSNIRWRWVRTQVPEIEDMSARSLQYRYQAALRDVVAELTFRKAADALAK